MKTTNLKTDRRNIPQALETFIVCLKGDKKDDLLASEMFVTETYMWDDVSKYRSCRSDSSGHHWSDYYSARIDCMPTSLDGLELPLREVYIQEWLPAFGEVQ